MSTLYEYDIETVTEKIISVLESADIDMLGFVSPTHFSCQMVEIIESLHQKNYYPTIVYNSNGYDNPEILEQISDYIDIYLPDFKYADNELADQLSDAPDYFEHAINAINEMYRQKGSCLTVDQSGLARNGIIIRHLVLPGQTENSKKVIKAIAGISTNIHISLMAQYYPPFHLPVPSLNRTLYKHEYEEILLLMEELEIGNGWIQELDSSSYYQPDFEKDNPFK